MTSRIRCAILRCPDVGVNPLGILLGAVFRAWGLIASENVSQSCCEWGSSAPVVRLNGELLTKIYYAAASRNW
jgi:hypothetical protein